MEYIYIVHGKQSCKVAAKAITRTAQSINGHDVPDAVQAFELNGGALYVYFDRFIKAVEMDKASREIRALREELESTH